ncbi:MAG TPA: hypothetical protein DEQ61_10970 [Streptomyces sp.]|nr:hypothetical protein [Streptomyces sp.]
MVVFQFVPGEGGAAQAHAAQESGGNPYLAVVVGAQCALHGQQSGFGAGAGRQCGREVAEDVLDADRLGGAAWPSGALSSAGAGLVDG